MVDGSSTAAAQRAYGCSCALPRIGGLCGFWRLRSGIRRGMDWLVLRLRDLARPLGTHAWCSLAYLAWKYAAMTTVLELQGMCYAYGRNSVLQGVDLKLEKGDFVALIGANGSGKSTLLRCAAAIELPTGGAVRVDGIDTRGDPVAAKLHLGYGVAPGALPTLLTGRECLRLFAQSRSLKEIPESSLALARRLELELHLDRSVAHYSLGTRQKLGIVLGLLGEPELLLLDEPLNGLDPMSAYALKQHLQGLVQERGVAILLATHSLDIAERFINRAVLLHDGKIVRSWDIAELDAVRGDPRRSLEHEMVLALQRAR
ncbi:ABC transporter ATP-binding protein [Xanthomonas campestris pv. campestris]